VKIRFWNSLFTAIAVSFGVVTLASYFIQADLLLSLRLVFTGWAALLAAVAVIVGVLNLVNVHFKKIGDLGSGWLYSIFLILGLLISLGAGFVPPLLVWFGIAAPTPDNPMNSGTANLASQLVFRHLLTTVGTAIAGLLVFVLVLAGYRLLRRRLSVTLVSFVVFAVIALLALAPWPAALSGEAGLRDLLRAFSSVFAIGGGRGLLLGIALGVVATGLRILLAMDRPYGE
jgi:hypothetical protein